MFKRHLEKKLHEMSKHFPCIFLTGPRQSGKTTLSKLAFPDHRYISLENPNVLASIQYDPLGYLGSDRWVIDEAQVFPDLFKYLQGMVDDDPTTGRFILSGSQNFLLNAHISQSLAGRVGILELLPLTYAEFLTDHEAIDLWSYILQGQYPRPYAQNIPYQDWVASYIRTYVERDVRALLNVQDLGRFQLFLKLCAARHGQLLNLSNLAVDAGISQTTATTWIGLLEASYLCFRLKPYYNNMRKRLVKMPKLYFYDSGLVCFLLGIDSVSTLKTHPMKGPLFEGFIISELTKKFYNKGQVSPLYFWQDHSGFEIDIIQETSDGIRPIEIKSSETFQSGFLDNIIKFSNIEQKQVDRTLVYCGKDQFVQKDVQVQPWDTFCLEAVSQLIY